MNTNYISTTYGGDEEVAIDRVAIVDVEKVSSQKPYFLDYDPISPTELEETSKYEVTPSMKARTDVSTHNSGYVSENFIMDKEFERDGEISDYELAACGYTKKEFTQDDNTINLSGKPNYVDRIQEEKECINICDKTKHFLDENPIPPDYMLSYETREHRSLDRNFERQNEHRSLSSSSFDRKCSLDPILRSSRENIREPLYTFSRFLDNEENINIVSKTFSPLLPRDQSWAESYDRCYDPAQLGILESSTKTEIDKMGPSVESIYSLFSMLGSNDSLEISKKLLELSQTAETCTALRKFGCVPLLVQIMNADGDEGVRKYASMALHNVVHSHPDEKAGRRELKVLRLLDQLTDYCNFLKTLLQIGGETIADDSDRHPLAAISSLMKVSFDEEHRHTMCELGALHVIPSLVHLDHAVHGPKPEEQCCNSLRRYALMALTNLTFGDENNKALLCSQKVFMEALVVQLESAPDDLLQVTASVLRNLSWRADSNMKAILNEIGTVTALARAAMKNKSENTLKAILSALWNLSAHCSRNKAEFCAVEGALGFLVDMLSYEGPSKTLKIIENAGGILRNVSSHVAVRAQYREILRERNCLAILLQQLKSESLTVVSNSCGTLWNLSARCPVDQKFLWDNGAVPMLRSLIHSKHAMISEGSSSALKNLLNFRPSLQNQTQMDHIARSMGLKKLPTLNARKQKALQQELEAKQHNETCENLDIAPLGTSNENSNFDTNFNKKQICNATSIRNIGIPKAGNNTRFTSSAVLPKSESRDSIFSAKSDSVYENSVRSRSEVDGNRTAEHPAYVVEVKRDFIHLAHNVKHIEEHPMDYSMQFKENIQRPHYNECESQDVSISKVPDSNGSNYTAYQETDIDQPTDFSLRYAENQLESDADTYPTNAEIALGGCDDLKAKKSHVKQVNNRNEILLILEDSVKCYQTEDTPYVISNAASVTDLHQNKGYNSIIENIKTDTNESTTNNKKADQPTSLVNFGSGVNTPDKPINYCEEGTPVYFSRYESLSSLNESPQDEAKNSSNSNNRNQIEGVLEYKCDSNDGNISKHSEQFGKFVKPSDKDSSSRVTPKMSDTCPSTSNAINSAHETPLMFSRHSSMDSLPDDEDVYPGDDKSSVVSDFSRLASGIISPSDIPDSPTQSIPQSPGRISGSGTSFPLPTMRSTVRSAIDMKHLPRLRSVFEDDLNTFHVENTPANFSSATSLSNLNILEDHTNDQTQQANANSSSSDATADLVKDIANMRLESSTISEGEEESGVNNNDDDLLLANCINIGMSRTTASPLAKISCDKILTNKIVENSIPLVEVPTEYCTEDTPAFLSKVGSNTNLSSISINSNMGNKDEPLCEITKNEAESVKDFANKINSNHYPLNFSGGLSSNASEAGGEDNELSSINILQQCIRDGMKKNPNATKNSNLVINNEDPVDMMRRGGNSLPMYLPVADETNKFNVEGTPCNFSVMSALSNLTVGSSLVGPAIQIKSNSKMDSAVKGTKNNRKYLNRKKDLSGVNNKNSSQSKNQPDDSLSSLSIDSEDDMNLLSQAIAAGYNRPKSNLGFSSSNITNTKRSTSLSISQPIPINMAPSASLTSVTPSSSNSRRQRIKKYANDSYSSMDSSDSNDNQSKSLFELCIITGMNKRHNHSADNNNRKRGNSNKNNTKLESKSSAVYTNFKRFSSNPDDSLGCTQQHPSEGHNNVIQHERERNDEQLLMECINTGISRKIGEKLTKSTFENLKIQKSIKPNESVTLSSIPKNAKPTSVAALEPHHQKAVSTFRSARNTAASDVGQNPVNCTIMNNRNVDDIIDDQRSPPEKFQEEILTWPINTNTQITEIDIGNKINIGYNPKTNMVNSIKKDSSSVDNKNSSYEEKHKNPDVMLKSVERLTKEFVSSAEYSRTNGFYDTNDSKKGLIKLILTDPVSSYSNNTWNEDTSPNDISFPSVSFSAPLVEPFDCKDYGDDDDNERKKEGNDIETTDEIEIIDSSEISSAAIHHHKAAEAIQDIDEPPIHQQLSSLDTESETLIVTRYWSESQSEGDPSKLENVISFHVGGEVQNPSATHPSQLLNYKMHNSTKIAMEARHLADNFLNIYQDNHSEFSCSISSLDLDNVRPPSGMESLNMSGYYDDPSTKPGNSTYSQPNSIQRFYKAQSPNMIRKSPKFPRKSLPMGLVARRALGQLHTPFSGSTESVNSSCVLLDNIKPPSLMDELLDSMISVESIQSEIVDCDSLETTVTASNYDTANVCLESDDNTVTLQSCYDTTYSWEQEDASVNSGTLFPSDCEYSSMESTPRNFNSNIPLEMKQSLTPKQKRKISKDRFKTYTIVTDVTSNQNEAELQSTRQNVNAHYEETQFVNHDFKTEFSSDMNNEHEEMSQIEEIKIADSEAESSVQNENHNIRVDSRDRCAENGLFIKPESSLTESGFCNVYDGNQNSESESVKGCDAKIAEFKSSAKEGIENEVPLQSETIKPRIIKPDNNDVEAWSSNDKSLRTENPSIRGRKKPAYVSPYKMQHQRGATPRPPSSSKSTTTVSTSPAFQKSNTKAIAPQALRQYVAPSSKSDHPHLERQGTFVKEEPSTNVQVPVVDSAVIQPVSPNRISKLPTKKAMTTSPKSAAKVNNPRSPVPAKPTNVKLSFTRMTPTRTQRSNSNASLRPNLGTTRLAALSSRISSTTPPSRSNSNLNCGSSNTASKSAPSGKLLQARSRIAYIWKSVDEVKNSPTTITTKLNSKVASTSLKQNSSPKTTPVFANKKNLESTSANSNTREQMPATAKYMDTQKISPKSDKTSPSKIAVSKLKNLTNRKNNSVYKK